MTQRSRWFVCTDYEVCLDFWENISENCSYIYIGAETCPSTGRIHWQIFYGLKNASTINAQIKKLKPRHVEIMNGSIKQNAKYCSKEGKKILEWGELPEPGKRSDLEGLAQSIRDGNDITEMLENSPGATIKYVGNIQKLQLYFHIKRNWEMDVRIYWGPPGTGKSRSVWDTFGVDNVYVKTPGKWWDGYRGEEVVLIDDFDPENCFDIQYDMYLKLMDRYPLLLEVKGGMTQMRSKIIVFTSNMDPEGWFLYKNNRKAFFRRVNTIQKFE